MCRNFIMQHNRGTITFEQLVYLSKHNNIQFTEGTCKVALVTLPFT